MNDKTVALEKAGLIPYVFVKSEPLFKFMVPSDPAFGGSKPSIAKGNIDFGESCIEAAIREAEEEVGLIKSNIKNSTIQVIWPKDIVWAGNTCYSLIVYACEVKNSHDFTNPHYETGKTFWLTAKEFSEVGKNWQIPIVNRARNLIRQTI